MCILLEIGIPITEGMESLKEASNQKMKEDFDCGRSYSNPEVHSVSNGFFKQDSERLVLEEFQVEGLSTLKNAKVHSVLECLGIKIVKENSKGSTLGERGAETQDKVYVRNRLAKSGSPQYV